MDYITELQIEKNNLIECYESGCKSYEEIIKDIERIERLIYNLTK